MAQTRDRLLSPARLQPKGWRDPVIRSGWKSALMWLKTDEGNAPIELRTRTAAETKHCRIVPRILRVRCGESNIAPQHSRLGQRSEMIPERCSSKRASGRAQSPRTKRLFTFSQRRRARSTTGRKRRASGSSPSASAARRRVSALTNFWCRAISSARISLPCENSRGKGKA